MWTTIGCLENEKYESSSDQSCGHKKFKERDFQQISLLSKNSVKMLNSDKDQRPIKILNGPN